MTEATLGAPPGHAPREVAPAESGAREPELDNELEDKW